MKPYRKAEASIGERFGRLVAVAIAARLPRSRKAIMECICDCGGHTIVHLTDLRSGGTQSCRCLHRERASTAKTTHGKSKLRAYRSWKAMRVRCLNPRTAAFKNYGGRGIRICSRWDDFENFYRDMGDPPTHKHTLERKDTNGNYTADNCRWATRTEQARNKRRHVLSLEKAAVIRQLRSEGRTYRYIAATMGITESNVNHVLNGECWQEGVREVEKATPFALL